jgi:hypothetical protein
LADFLWPTILTYRRSEPTLRFIDLGMVMHWSKAT